MTSPANGNGNVPPLRALVFILASFALMLIGGLTLYGFTEPANRPDLLNRLGTWLPTIVLTIPAVLTWLTTGATARRANEAAIVSRRVEAKLDTVSDQVNGQFTELVQRVGPPTPK